MNAALPTIATSQKPSLVAKIAGRYSVDSTKMLSTLKATAFRVENGAVSDEQMMALLIVADQYGLNPFTKELFAFPDKNKGIVPVVSVDGWARIINEHPQMDGLEFRYGPEKGAHFEWVECVIYRKDRSRPIVVREFWNEVARTTGPWQSHGNRMHRHKTLIQCARVAFGFGGIYDEDEAERITEKEINATPAPVVEMPRAKPSQEAERQSAPVVIENNERDHPPSDASPSSSEPAAQPAESGEVTPQNAMTPGQVSMVQAKMKRAAITEIDFEAKWGKSLLDGSDFPRFTKAEVNDILAWIDSKAG